MEFSILVGTKNNIRFQATESKIKQAVIDQLNHQQTSPISDITVSDVCKKAKITRGTFYKHYTSINACISAIEKDISDKLIRVKVDDQETNIDHIIIHILQIIQENNGIVLFIFRQDPSFLTKILDRIKERFFDAIVSDVSELSSSEKKYVYEYSVFGTIAIIRQWLENNMVETSEEICKYILHWRYE